MPSRNVIPTLAHVVRGLTLLFWAVPAVLLTSTTCALDLGWRQFGYAPPVISSGILVYGMLQFRHFHPGEKVWVASWQRSLLLSWILLAQSPLPIWWQRAPEEPFFAQGMLTLSISGTFFLIALNDMLLRLAAMLPDQALRAETLFFTRLNVRLLLFILFGILLWIGMPRIENPPAAISRVHELIELSRPWLFIMILLPPVALTMTLLWKAKGVILISVFGRGSDSASKVP